MMVSRKFLEEGDGVRPLAFLDDANRTVLHNIVPLMLVIVCYPLLSATPTRV